MELKLLKINNWNNSALFKYGYKLLSIEFAYDREFVYLPLNVQFECEFHHLELKDYNNFFQLKKLEPASAEVVKLIEEALKDDKKMDNKTL